MEAIISLCQASMENGTGVTLFVGSQQVPLVVTAIEGREHVEGHNQQYSTLVVMLSAVTGAALS
jgi:hypothetical protein